MNRLACLAVCALVLASARASVIIIGGGIAGVSTGRVLFDAGVDDFLIMEARPEIGGRMLSVDFNGYRVQPGANWITGTSRASDGTLNPIWEIAQEIGTPGSTVNWESGMYYDSQGNRLNNGQMNPYWDAIEEAFRDVSNYDATLDEDIDSNWNISYEAAMQMFGYQQGQTPEQRLMSDFITWVEFDWDSACPPDEVALMGSSRSDTGRWGSDEFMVADGFEKIPQYLARDFTDKILVNTVVTDVLRDPDGVTVVTTQGTFRADQVVSTVSIAMLRLNSVNYVPPLPPQQLAAIAKHTGTNVYGRLYMQFDDVFWPNNVEYFYYQSVIRGSHPAWINYNHNKYYPGSGILCLDMVDILGERMESLGADLAAEEAMVVLRTIFGAGIPSPTSAFVSNWSQSQFFRMSYTDWPVGFTRDDSNTMCASVDGQVFIGGEACSQEFYGFTHGGLIDGRRLAAEVLAAMDR